MEVYSIICPCCGERVDPLPVFSRVNGEDELDYYECPVCEEVLYESVTDEFTARAKDNTNI